MKKAKMLLLIVVMAIVGILFVQNRLEYTSFQDLVLNQLQEGDIRINIDRYADDARVSITDKATVEKLLNAFSRMELKRTRVSVPDGTYAIRIYVNRAAAFGMMLQDEHYVWIINEKDRRSHFYEIVNDIDPNKVIESMPLPWQFPNR